MKFFVQTDVEDCMATRSIYSSHDATVELALPYLVKQIADRK